MSHNHPFFFLHGLEAVRVRDRQTGHDRVLDHVLAFLALRRSCDYDWDLKASPAANYRWDTGIVRGMESELTRMSGGDVVPNQSFGVEQKVSTLSSIGQDQAA